MCDVERLIDLGVDVVAVSGRSLGTGRPNNGICGSGGDDLLRCSSSESAGRVDPSRFETGRDHGFPKDPVNVSSCGRGGNISPGFDSLLDVMPNSANRAPEARHRLSECFADARSFGYTPIADVFAKCKFDNDEGCVVLLSDSDGAFASCFLYSAIWSLGNDRTSWSVSDGTRSEKM